MEEFVALTDPRLSLFSGEEEQCDSYSDTPQHKITNFRCCMFSVTRRPVRGIINHYRPYATGRLEDSRRRIDKKISCKTRNAQSRATLFHHSAVLSVPAVLLCKLPHVEYTMVLVLEWCNLHSDTVILFKCKLVCTKQNEKLISKEIFVVYCWCGSEVLKFSLKQADKSQISTSP